MSEINERLLTELVEAVKDIVRKDESDRLRDVYLIGDIEKGEMTIHGRSES